MTALADREFFGYRRENGRVGIRNHMVILPLDDLSNAASEKVANNIDGCLALPHHYGRLQFGADLDLHFRTLIGTGKNPNVAACIVIGIEPGWTQAGRRGHRGHRQACRRLCHRGQRRDQDRGRRLTHCPSLRATDHRDAARALQGLRPLDLDQVRRVRHDVRPRLLPDGRQPD